MLFQLLRLTFVCQGVLGVSCYGRFYLCEDKEVFFIGQLGSDFILLAQCGGQGFSFRDVLIQRGGKGYRGSQRFYCFFFGVVFLRFAFQVIFFMIILGFWELVGLSRIWGFILQDYSRERLDLVVLVVLFVFVIYYSNYLFG